MKKFVLTFCAAACALLQIPAAANAATPLRHLVYAFTYGSQSTQTSHTSGIDEGSGTGVNDAKAYGHDEGTIAVDVMQQEPDGGLVVSVSEAAKDVRSAPVAVCAVYGFTLSVVCDSSIKVNTEELSLLRVIGRNFIGPLDAKKHWRIGQGTPDFTETNDFTISRSDGAVLTIDELRVGQLHGAGGYDSNITGTIVYDSKLTIPSAVHEEEVKRQNQGQDYSTVRTDVTLKLTSDSLAQVKP